MFIIKPKPKPEPGVNQKIIIDKIAKTFDVVTDDCIYYTVYDKFDDKNEQLLSNFKFDNNKIVLHDYDNWERFANVVHFINYLGKESKNYKTPLNKLLRENGFFAKQVGSTLIQITDFLEDDFLSGSFDLIDGDYFLTDDNFEEGQIYSKDPFTINQVLEFVLSSRKLYNSLKFI